MLPSRWAAFAPATLAAALLFTMAWLVLGSISRGFTMFGERIEPYNWVAQPVSGLGLSETAPWMNAAFIMTGALLALGLLGVMSALQTLSPLERLLFGALFLLSALGPVLSGLFTLEQFMLHFTGFLLATALPVVTFLLLGWRLSGTPIHAAMGQLLFCASGLTLVLLVAFFFSFDPVVSGKGLGYSGLIQRLLITEVLGVFALLGWSLRPAGAP